jgi:hypothetical protein
MALLSLKVFELTVYLTKAVTSILYQIVIYCYRVLLLVGRKLNICGFFLPSDHLLTQRRQRNSKDGSTVFLHISLRLVWHNVNCVMFAYGFYSSVIEDADLQEYDSRERQLDSEDRGSKLRLDICIYLPVDIVAYCRIKTKLKALFIFPQ